MKSILTLIAFLGFQFICLAQVPRDSKVLNTKKIIKDDPSKDKIVSYEFTFSQISVAEATRNSIDNNDCRQTWGDVRVTFYELDANGQLIEDKWIKADLAVVNARNLVTNVLFHSAVYDPPFRANSYYQDRRGVSDENYIKRLSVRVSENMVKNRRIVALVHCVIQTAHKDNDFATFDHLEMVGEAKTATFYFEDVPSKDETMSVITNGSYMMNGRSKVKVSGQNHSDDTHRIWLHFTIKKKP